MNKDDIMQALRLTAMGRCGHPLQEQLAEKLAGLFAPEPKTAVEVAETSIAVAETKKRQPRAKAD